QEVHLVTERLPAPKLSPPPQEPAPANVPPAPSETAARPPAAKRTSTHPSRSANPPSTPERTSPRDADATAQAAGVIRWSGRLPRNSILVISGNRASFGALSGGLPGTPVTVEVEPAFVQVREAPSERNAWERIILYITDQSASSITIRWRASAPQAR